MSEDYGQHIPDDITCVLIHRLQHGMDIKWEVAFMREGKKPIIQIFFNDSFKAKAIHDNFTHQGWELTIDRFSDIHALTRPIHD